MAPSLCLIFFRYYTLLYLCACCVYFFMLIFVNFYRNGQTSGGLPSGAALMLAWRGTRNYLSCMIKLVDCTNHQGRGTSVFRLDTGHRPKNSCCSVPFLPRKTTGLSAPSRGFHSVSLRSCPIVAGQPVLALSWSTKLAENHRRFRPQQRADRVTRPPLWCWSCCCCSPPWRNSATRSSPPPSPPSLRPGRRRTAPIGVTTDRASGTMHWWEVSTQTRSTSWATHGDHLPKQSYK